jgi:hypothetical protein
MASPVARRLRADSKRGPVRTAWPEERGYRVIRFWNNEALANTEGMLLSILDALRPSPPSPTLPLKGGGGFWSSRSRFAPCLSARISRAF